MTNTRITRVTRNDNIVFVVCVWERRDFRLLSHADHADVGIPLANGGGALGERGGSSVISDRASFCCTIRSSQESDVSSM